MSAAPKAFQYQLTFWGSFLFLVSFPIADYCKANGMLTIAQVFIGYSLGFLLSFSTTVILEMFRGNSYKFIVQNPILKPFSYLCLLVIFSLSGLAIYSTNYTSISYSYNTAVVLGGIIATFGLIPVISHHES